MNITDVFDEWRRDVWGGMALLGELDDLRERLAQACFAPLGDNRHNAALCPYCGEPLRKALEMIKQLRDLGRQQQVAIEDLHGMADAVERLRDIGRATGCAHVDDPDGRLHLVRCVETTLADEERRSAAAQAKHSSLVLAVRLFLDADHDEHFATRLNDAEMAALNELKKLVVG